MSEFLSLKEYDRLASMMLVRNNLPVSDHNIAFVNEYMMKADMVYKEDVTDRDRDRFRLYYAKFAIRKLFGKLKKENERGKMFKSLDVEGESRQGSRPIKWELVDKRAENPHNALVRAEIKESIENSAKLTTKEKYLVIQHCFNNVPLKDIRDSLSVGAYYLIGDSREKLRWLESKYLE